MSGICPNLYHFNLFLSLTQIELKLALTRIIHQVTSTNSRYYFRSHIMIIFIIIFVI